MSVDTVPVPLMESSTISPLGTDPTVAQISSPGAATHRTTPPKVFSEKLPRWTVEAKVGPVVAAAWNCVVAAMESVLAAAGVWLVGVAVAVVATRRNAIWLTVEAVDVPAM